jgi:hypothetical protein
LLIAVHVPLLAAGVVLPPLAAGVVVVVAGVCDGVGVVGVLATGGRAAPPAALPVLATGVTGLLAEAGVVAVLVGVALLAAVAAGVTGVAGRAAAGEPEAVSLAPPQAPNNTPDVRIANRYKLRMVQSPHWPRGPMSSLVRVSWHW